MGRLTLAGSVLLVLTAPLAAHYLYLAPQPPGGFTVVFNDGPKSDDRAANTDAFQKVTFSRRNVAGQVTQVTPKTGADGRLQLDDAAVVYASVPYGVVSRGDPKPVLIVYHPKAVGGVLRPGDRSPAAGLPLELTPAPAADGLGFVLTQAGQPVAGADVAVIPPGETKPTMVKTDAAGRTPGFERAGDYAARAYRPVAAAGEHQGRRYDGERHYATLTVRYAGGK